MAKKRKLMTPVTDSLPCQLDGQLFGQLIGNHPARLMDSCLGSYLSTGYALWQSSLGFQRKWVVHNIIMTFVCLWFCLFD